MSNHAVSNRSVSNRAVSNRAECVSNRAVSNRSVFNRYVSKRDAPVTDVEDVGHPSAVLYRESQRLKNAFDALSFFFLDNWI